jgi:hypothetical protein
LAVKALAVAHDTGAGAYPALDDYATAGNRRSAGQAFTVRVGLEFTESFEKQLVLLFIRAATLTNLVAIGSEPVVPAVVDAHVRDAVTAAQVRPLFRGVLVVRYEPGEWPWSVGFEFTHVAQRYTYGIFGTANSGIVHGDLPPSNQGLSGPRLLDRLLPGDEKAGAPPGYGDFDRFELGMLLPAPGEYVNVAVQPIPQQGGTPILNEFGQHFPSPQNNRLFTIASVLDRIVSQSLVMLGDRRGLPSLHYSHRDLQRAPLLSDGSEVPAALWALQGGGPAERREFARVRSLFNRLTGQRVEIRHAPVASPPQVTGTPTSPEDATLRIEPMVVDGGIDIPVQFAGAGIWEGLVLSTMGVDRRGKVLLLDEPASHLHPTLQARFWQELAGARMQSILITHSAYLVPHASQADLESVVRILRKEGHSCVRRLPRATQDLDDDGLPRSRWLQLVRSADMRAALFADAVVLVEGPSDLVALTVWWPKSRTAQRVGAPSDLNLVLLEAEGEAGFDAVTRFLDSFAIPWTIICDGKAVSPTGQNALIRRLTNLDASGSPATDAKFDRWRKWWESRGIYTLAEAADDEIERFFERQDPRAWEAAKRQERGRSKPRKARAFANVTPCPLAAERLYGQVLARLVAR